jgi:hypothetical protein
MFQDGVAFPLVADSNSRSQLQQAALSYPGVIPSLRIFLENTKYLKVMTDVIKQVLPPRFKGTIRQAMFRSYVNPEDLQFKVQTSENDFKYQKGLKGYGFWSAYRQIFLFAMRHFFGLTDSRPLGFTQSPCPQRYDRSELWRRFKLLAGQLGFSLPGCKSAQPASSPEFVAIHTLLTRLRPPELFLSDNSTLTEWSNHVASLLLEINPRNIPDTVPVQSWDKVEDWSLDKRCGMTNTETFFSDQRHLFLHNIYSKDEAARENMTSFAVKRDIFKSFFPAFSGDVDMDITVEQDHCDSSRHGQRIDDPPIVTAQPANMSQSIIHQPNLSLERIPQRQIELPQPPPAHQSTSGLNWSSTSSCKFTVNMSANEFYASCFPFLHKLDGVLFFHMSKCQVTCVLPDGIDQLSNLVEDMPNTWFARIIDNSLILKTLTLQEVWEQCHRGKCIIFFGDNWNSFTGRLERTHAQEIQLPTYDRGTTQWSLTPFSH